MHSRLLILSLGLHGAVILGAATLWGLGPRALRPELRLTVSPPAPELAWPLEEPRPEPPVAEPEPEQPPPLAEPELPPPPLDFEPVEDTPEDLGPWKLAAPRRWSEAALVKIVRKPEAPPPEVVPQQQPPAELVRARLLDDSNEPPRYPKMAQRLGLEGVVVLRLHVDPSGLVDEVEIAASSGYAILDRAAVEAARDWRFVPATRGDLPVADVVEKTIEFDLQD